jgi:hypothetical protein
MVKATLYFAVVAIGEHAVKQKVKTASKIFSRVTMSRPARPEGKVHTLNRKS